MPTTQIEYVLYLDRRSVPFFLFGKNVCSASYALPFLCKTAIQFVW